METVLLRTSDFPTGWAKSTKATVNSGDAEAIKASQGIAACSAFRTQSELEKQQAKLSSSTFADSAMPSDTASNASNQVVGYKTEGQAKTAYTAFAGAETGTCLQQIFNKILQEQVSALNAKGGPQAAVTAEVQRLGVPAAGDATTAYEIVVTIDVSGQSQQLAFVVQIVRVGQYLVSYNATLYQAAPDKFGQTLVDRSVSRLESALRGASTKV